MTGSKFHFLIKIKNFIESLSCYRCQSYREDENIASNLRHLRYFAGKTFLTIHKRLFAILGKLTNISQSSLHIK